MFRLVPHGGEIDLQWIGGNRPAGIGTIGGAAALLRAANGSVKDLIKRGECGHWE